MEVNVGFDGAHLEYEYCSVHLIWTGQGRRELRRSSEGGSGRIGFTSPGMKKVPGCIACVVENSWGNFMFVCTKNSRLVVPRAVFSLVPDDFESCTERPR